MQRLAADGEDQWTPQPTNESFPRGTGPETAAMLVSEPAAFATHPAVGEDEIDGGGVATADVSGGAAGAGDSCTEPFAFLNAGAAAALDDVHGAEAESLEGLDIITAADEDAARRAPFDAVGGSPVLAPSGDGHPHGSGPSTADARQQGGYASDARRGAAWGTSSSQPPALEAVAAAATSSTSQQQLGTLLADRRMASSAVLSASNLAALVREHAAPGSGAGGHHGAVFSATACALCETVFRCAAHLVSMTPPSSPTAIRLWAKLDATSADKLLQFVTASLLLSPWGVTEARLILNLRKLINRDIVAIRTTSSARRSNISVSRHYLGHFGGVDEVKMVLLGVSLIRVLDAVIDVGHAVQQKRDTLLLLRGARRSEIISAVVSPSRHDPFVVSESSASRAERCSSRLHTCVLSNLVFLLSSNSAMAAEGPPSWYRSSSSPTCCPVHQSMRPLLLGLGALLRPLDGAATDTAAASTLIQLVSLARDAVAVEEGRSEGSRCCDDDDDDDAAWRSSAPDEFGWSAAHYVAVATLLAQSSGSQNAEGEKNERSGDGTEAQRWFKSRWGALGLDGLILRLFPGAAHSTTCRYAYGQLPFADDDKPLGASLHGRTHSEFMSSPMKQQPSSSVFFTSADAPSVKAAGAPTPPPMLLLISWSRASAVLFRENVEGQQWLLDLDLFRAASRRGTTTPEKLLHLPTLPSAHSGVLNSSFDSDIGGPTGAATGVASCWGGLVHEFPSWKAVAAPVVDHDSSGVLAAAMASGSDVDASSAFPSAPRGVGPLDAKKDAERGDATTVTSNGVLVTVISLISRDWVLCLVDDGRPGAFCEGELLFVRTFLLRSRCPSEAKAFSEGSPLLFDSPGGANPESAASSSSPSPPPPAGTRKQTARLNITDTMLSVLCRTSETFSVEIQYSDARRIANRIEFGFILRSKESYTLQTGVVLSHPVRHFARSRGPNASVTNACPAAVEENGNDRAQSQAPPLPSAASPSVNASTRAFLTHDDAASALRVLAPCGSMLLALPQLKRGNIDANRVFHGDRLQLLVPRGQPLCLWTPCTGEIRSWRDFFALHHRGDPPQQPSAVFPRMSRTLLHLCAQWVRTPDLHRAHALQGGDSSSGGGAGATATDNSRGAATFRPRDDHSDSPLVIASTPSPIRNVSPLTLPPQPPRVAKRGGGDVGSEDTIRVATNNNDELAQRQLLAFTVFECAALRAAAEDIDAPGEESEGALASWRVVDSELRTPLMAALQGHLDALRFLPHHALAFANLDHLLRATSSPTSSTPAIPLIALTTSAASKEKADACRRAITAMWASTDLLPCFPMQLQLAEMRWESAAALVTQYYNEEAWATMCGYLLTLVSGCGAHGRRDVVSFMEAALVLTYEGSELLLSWLKGERLPDTRAVMLPLTTVASPFAPVGPREARKPPRSAAAAEGSAGTTGGRPPSLLPPPPSHGLSAPTNRQVTFKSLLYSPIETFFILAPIDALLDVAPSTTSERIDVDDHLSSATMSMLLPDVQWLLHAYVLTVLQEVEAVALSAAERGGPPSGGGGGPWQATAVAATLTLLASSVRFEFVLQALLRRKLYTVATEFIALFRDPKAHLHEAGKLGAVATNVAATSVSPTTFAAALEQQQYQRTQKQKAKLWATAGVLLEAFPFASTYLGLPVVVRTQIGVDFTAFCVPLTEPPTRDEVEIFLAHRFRSIDEDTSLDITVVLLHALQRMEYRQGTDAYAALEDRKRMIIDHPETDLKYLVHVGNVTDFPMCERAGELLMHIRSVERREVYYIGEVALPRSRPMALQALPRFQHLCDPLQFPFHWLLNRSLHRFADEGELGPRGAKFWSSPEYPVEARRSMYTRADVMNLPRTGALSFSTKVVEERAGSRDSITLHRHRLVDGVLHQEDVVVGDQSGGDFGTDSSDAVPLFILTVNGTPLLLSDFCELPQTTPFRPPPPADAAYFAYVHPRSVTEPLASDDAGERQDAMCGASTLLRTFVYASLGADRTTCEPIAGAGGAAVEPAAQGALLPVVAGQSGVGGAGQDTRSTGSNSAADSGSSDSGSEEDSDDEAVAEILGEYLPIPIEQLIIRGGFVFVDESLTSIVQVRALDSGVDLTFSAPKRLPISLAPDDAHAAREQLAAADAPAEPPRDATAIWVAQGGGGAKVSEVEWLLVPSDAHFQDWKDVGITRFGWVPGHVAQRASILNSRHGGFAVEVVAPFRMEYSIELARESIPSRIFRRSAGRGQDEHREEALYANYIIFALNPAQQQTALAASRAVSTELALRGSSASQPTRRPMVECIVDDLRQLTEKLATELSRNAVASGCSSICIASPDAAEARHHYASLHSLELYSSTPLQLAVRLRNASVVRAMVLHDNAHSLWQSSRPLSDQGLAHDDSLLIEAVHLTALSPNDIRAMPYHSNVSTIDSKPRIFPYALARVMAEDLAEADYQLSFEPDEQCGPLLLANGRRGDKAARAARRRERRARATPSRQQQQQQQHLGGENLRARSGHWFLVSKSTGRRLRLASRPVPRFLEGTNYEAAAFALDADEQANKFGAFVYFNANRSVVKLRHVVFPPRYIHGDVEAPEFVESESLRKNQNEATDNYVYGPIQAAVQLSLFDWCIGALPLPMMRAAFPRLTSRQLTAIIAASTAEATAAAATAAAAASSGTSSSSPRSFTALWTMMEPSSHTPATMPEGAFAVTIVPTATLFQLNLGMATHGGALSFAATAPNSAAGGGGAGGQARQSVAEGKHIVYLFPLMTETRKWRPRTRRPAAQHLIPQDCVSVRPSVEVVSVLVEAALRDPLRDAFGLYSSWHQLDLNAIALMFQYGLSGILKDVIPRLRAIMEQRRGPSLNAALLSSMFNKASLRVPYALCDERGFAMSGLIESGLSLLHWSALIGNEPLLASILRAIGQYAAYQQLWSTTDILRLGPVHLAAYSGNSTVVQMLVSILTKPSDRLLLLNRLAFNDYSSIELLDSGVANEGRPSGTTGALGASPGRLHPPAPNERRSEQEDAPAGARNGHRATLDMQFSRDMNTFSALSGRATPLITAITFRHYAVAKTLLELGARCSVRCNLQATTKKPDKDSGIPIGEQVKDALLMLDAHDVLLMREFVKERLEIVQHGTTVKGLNRLSASFKFGGNSDDDSDDNDQEGGGGGGDGAHDDERPDLFGPEAGGVLATIASGGPAGDREEVLVFTAVPPEGKKAKKGSGGGGGRGRGRGRGGGGGGGREKKSKAPEGPLFTLTSAALGIQPKCGKGGAAFKREKELPADKLFEDMRDDQLIARKLHRQALGKLALYLTGLTLFLVALAYYGRLMLVNHSRGFGHEFGLTQMVLGALEDGDDASTLADVNDYLVDVFLDVVRSAAPSASEREEASAISDTLVALGAVSFGRLVTGGTDPLRRLNASHEVRRTDCFRGWCAPSSRAELVTAASEGAGASEADIGDNQESALPEWLRPTPHWAFDKGAIIESTQTRRRHKLREFGWLSIPNNATDEEIEQVREFLETGRFFPDGTTVIAALAAFHSIPYGASILAAIIFELQPSGEVQYSTAVLPTVTTLYSSEGSGSLRPLAEAVLALTWVVFVGFSIWSFVPYLRAAASYVAVEAKPKAKWFNATRRRRSDMVRDVWRALAGVARIGYHWIVRVIAQLLLVVIMSLMLAYHTRVAQIIAADDIPTVEVPSQAFAVDPTEPVGAKLVAVAYALQTIRVLVAAAGIGGAFASLWTMMLIPHGGPFIASFLLLVFHPRVLTIFLMHAVLGAGFAFALFTLYGASIDEYRSYPNALLNSIMFVTFGWEGASEPGINGVDTVSSTILFVLFTMYITVVYIIVLWVVVWAAYEETHEASVPWWFASIEQSYRRRQLCGAVYHRRSVDEPLSDEIRYLVEMREGREES